MKCFDKYCDRRTQLHFIRLFRREASRHLWNEKGECVKDKIMELAMNGKNNNLDGPST
jgi:hypothetical protein